MLIPESQTIENVINEKLLLKEYDDIIEIFNNYDCSKYFLKNYPLKFKLYDAPECFIKSNYLSFKYHAARYLFY